MDTITLLQHYWWLIISLLGALLVFLMFVQGGQALLYTIGRTEEERNMLVNSLGRKWEFTFTTLVTFGGAFFASFPLFYSTSFGGAFYVWMAILLCFVIQAVAYEYRRKPGNVFGERTFNAFLLVNGVLGPLLIGTAVGTFFTGAEFTVDRLNLANQGGAAVISQWATPWHGLEAVAEWRNVLLGLSVTLLAMTLACQYFMNNIDDEAIFRRAARRMRTFAVLFVACFVAWLLALVLADGWAVDAAGTVSVEPYKYLHNLVEMPYVAAALLIGMELLALGTWMYMKSTLGSGPRDALMVVLARKTHRTVGLCRAAVEVVIVFIGWRLGGQVGIGTIVAAVGVGSLFNLNFGLLRFNPALLHQENLPETLQRFRGRKTIT